MKITHHRPSPGFSDRSHATQCVFDASTKGHLHDHGLLACTVCTASEVVAVVRSLSNVRAPCHLVIAVLGIGRHAIA